MARGWCILKHANFTHTLNIMYQNKITEAPEAKGLITPFFLWIIYVLVKFFKPSNVRKQSVIFISAVRAYVTQVYVDKVIAVGSIFFCTFNTFYPKPMKHSK